MHVAFLTGPVGTCGSGEEDNGDQGGVIIDSYTSYNTTFAASEIILWATASPRPQCLPHRSAIDNKTGSNCGFQNTRCGYHTRNDICTPKTYYWEVVIDNVANPKTINVNTISACP